MKSCNIDIGNSYSFCQQCCDAKKKTDVVYSQTYLQHIRHLANYHADLRSTTTMLENTKLTRCECRRTLSNINLIRHRCLPLSPNDNYFCNTCSKATVGRFNYKFKTETELKHHQRKKKCYNDSKHTSTFSKKRSANNSNKNTKRGRR